MKNFPLSATAEEISAYLAPEATAVIRHSRFDVATYSHLFSGTVTTSFRSESECREFVESPLVLFQGNRLSRYHMVSGQNLDGFFGPGSVVRLDAPEGNFSRADIWFAVRRGSHVVANYVDYKEGVKVVWIRFCTAEDAMEFAGMVGRIVLDLEMDF